jgi:hypothetical protein
LGLISAELRKGGIYYYKVNVDAMIDILSSNHMTYAEYCESLGIHDVKTSEQDSRYSHCENQVFTMLKPGIHDVNTRYSPDENIDKTKSNTKSKTKVTITGIAPDEPAPEVETKDLGIFNLSPDDMVSEKEKYAMFKTLVARYPVGKVTKESKAKKVFLGMPFNKAKQALDNVERYIKIYRSKPQFVLELVNYLESNCYTEAWLVDNEKYDKSAFDTKNNVSTKF